MFQELRLFGAEESGFIVGVSVVVVVGITRMVGVGVEVVFGVIGRELGDLGQSLAEVGPDQKLCAAEVGLEDTQRQIEVCGGVARGGVVDA